MFQNYHELFSIGSFLKVNLQLNRAEPDHHHLTTHACLLRSAVHREKRLSIAVAAGQIEEEGEGESSSFAESEAPKSIFSLLHSLARFHGDLLRSSARP